MPDEVEAVEIPRGGDATFGALMDALVADAAAAAPATDAAPAAPAAPALGAPADAGAAGGAGAAAPGPAGAGAVPAAGGEPGAGAPATEPAPAGDGAPAGADGGAGPDGDGAGAGPGGGDRGAPRAEVDVAAISTDLAGLAEKFETTTTQAFQQQALEAVQQEYRPYFDALRQHPRLLVGTQVPKLVGEDGQMETLRDAADAREWQEAVKSLLTEEIQERATAALEENKGILDTVHASIELFTRNRDLVPGTRQFNRALADRFAAIARPYELRVEGKLHGYTIPVQPLIDQLRTQMAAEARTAPAAPAPAAAPAAPVPASDPPQKGIRSKAGAGADEEDFSTLFGTLGLPGLRF